MLLARLGSKHKEAVQKHDKSHISGYAKSGTGLNRLLFRTLTMHAISMGPRFPKLSAFMTLFQNDIPKKKMVDGV